MRELRTLGTDRVAIAITIPANTESAVTVSSLIAAAYSAVSDATISAADLRSRCVGYRIGRYQPNTAGTARGGFYVSTGGASGTSFTAGAEWIPDGEEFYEPCSQNQMSDYVRSDDTNTVDALLVLYLTRTPASR